MVPGLLGCCQHVSIFLIGKSLSSRLAIIILFCSETAVHFYISVCEFL